MKFKEKLFNRRKIRDSENSFAKSKSTKRNWYFWKLKYKFDFDKAYLSLVATNGVSAFQVVLWTKSSSLVT